MSKILDASCSAASVVTADGVPVTDATILSEGNQASTGLLLIDEDRARYVTSNAADIKTTIEKVSAALDTLNDALTKIASTLTSIGAGMTGSTTAPPGSLPTDVSDIVAYAASIAATKAELDTLKEALK